MKNLILLFITFVLVHTSFAQDSTYSVEDFNIRFDNSHLVVEDINKNIVYDRVFQNPNGFVLDLDNDGTGEFLVNDYTETDGQNFYTLYVFNTTGTFYLTDSIYSGLKDPYYFYSDEISNVVLVTGSPDFDSLNQAAAETSFSPLVCWSFVDSSLSIVNDQLYDIFLDENEANISYMDSVCKSKGRTCEASQEFRAAIAATYANYVYADENALAEKMLEEYYFCDDLKKFKEQISKLL
ncbi:MAG: hypothetical protein ACM3S2_17540 [Ignavibacteriales bacterium]